MTFIGRLLVILVLIISLTLLTWSTAVYTQRVDWFTPQGAGQSKGRIERLRAEIQQKLSQRRDAEQLLGRSLAEVRQLETVREQWREWYAGQLELVRLGSLDGVRQPGYDQPLPTAQTVQTMPVRLDADLPYDQPIGRPPELDAQGRPLQPISWYENQILAEAGILLQYQEQTEEALIAHTALTEEIFGTETAKGLRTKIREQFVIKQASEAEQKFLLPQIRNRRAEVALVRDRQDSLTSRVSEVKKYFGSVTEAGR